MTAEFAVVDSHQHLWDPGGLSYSWMAGLPSLRRRHLVDQYREAARGIGVSATVLVEGDIDEPDLPGETAALFDLARDPANRISGVVAGVRPENENFLSSLGRFVRDPKLKGARRVLHNQPDDLSRSSLFVENVRSLGDHGLSFDLCVHARQLPIALQLARACPRVLFVLDHCGGPEIEAGAIGAWQRDLGTLAREPNVRCKISGLAARADPATLSAAALKPYFDFAIASFGWERVLWGGDWPVCTLACSLGKWMEISRELASGASREHREALFLRNAVRIYRLEMNS